MSGLMRIRRHMHAWRRIIIVRTQQREQRRALQTVLQCVAVCCSVLQCVAVCCSVLHVLQCDDYAHTAARATQSLPDCVAVCCSVLQYVAVCVLSRLAHKCAV